MKNYEYWRTREVIIGFTNGGSMQLGKEILYLTQADVQAVDLPMVDIMDVLEEAFIEKLHGRVEMPPKPGIHPRPDAFVHAMPCWAPKHEAAGLKWVSGYPKNKEKGLPYIAGIMVMNDPETGMITSILDCGWITAMRTGGVTGMCARHMANPDSEVIGVLGCGVQGRANLEALLVACPNIKRVYAYDHRPANSEIYAQSQSEKFGIECVAVATHKEAVQDSDIVVTAGPITHTPDREIEKEWIKPGALLAPVDYDCMYKGGVIESVSRALFTDDSGQYRHFRAMGYFPYGPEDLPEVCGVIGKAVAGRLDKTDVLAAYNIGMALDDMPVAAKVVSRALEMGIGRVLPL